MDNRPALLVINDDPETCSALELVGRNMGYQVESRGSRQVTMPLLEAIHADVALIDLDASGFSSLDVLNAIRRVRPDCQVILTGRGTAESAIEAVTHGALDYLTTPVAVDRLKRMLANAHEEIRRRSALLIAEQDTARRLELCGMVGRSGEMQQLFALIRRLAPHVRAALITGEAGTGKETAARALHELGSGGRKRFIRVNCKTVDLSDPGWCEGADGDTLFLDDVEALAPEAQSTLLHTLETMPERRMIAATRCDLDAAVLAGCFSADLVSRLAAVRLDIPALRDRGEDIHYLMAAMMADCSRRFGKPLHSVSPAAERALRAHAWPGNVRELRHVVERICMLARTPCLTERDVARALPALDTPAPAANDAVRHEPEALESSEIQRALIATRGNKAAAARMLGVSRRMVYRRLSR